MTQKNTPDAKNRILSAAVRIFAEKSFEGSRIDEIAQEANVPKSLIYYHFKSKDEILEVLTQGFIDEYRSLILNPVNKVEGPEGLVKRVKTQYAEFGFKNADLVRVMFIDSLKKTKKEPILFRVVETLVHTENELSESTDAIPHFNQEHLVAEFFTSLIPLYSFICFSDAWVDYFKTDKETLGKHFLKLVVEAHAEYHKSHSGDKK